jgi:hypothetical protein
LNLELSRMFQVGKHTLRSFQFLQDNSGLRDNLQE